MQIKNAAHVAILSKGKRKKILLIQRRDVPWWVMPGGHLETKETFKQAAIREFEEETGLKVKLLTCKVSLEDKEKSFFKKIFLGQIIGGKMKLSSESKKIEWFEVNKLPQPMTLYEKHRIELVLTNNKNTIIETYKINAVKELFFQFLNPICFFVLLFYQMRKK